MTMTRYAADVRVMPRPFPLHPQGQALETALDTLGFQAVSDVRVGRALTFHPPLERSDPGATERDVRRMCERLRAHPVTADFSLSIRESP